MTFFAPIASIFFLVVAAEEQGEWYRVFVFADRFETFHTHTLATGWPRYSHWVIAYLHKIHRNIRVRSTKSAVSVDPIISWDVEDC